MCPNCVLNSAGAWSFLGPGLLCLLFFVIAGYFFFTASKSGELRGDEEEAKHTVFDD
jgi:hypothetical protein